MGTFVKSTFENGSIDYGYVAYVRVNHLARNREPDLLLYVMQDSEQSKGQPPMDKDELEKMAEHCLYGEEAVKKRYEEVEWAEHKVDLVLYLSEDDRNITYLAH